MSSRFLQIQTEAAYNTHSRTSSPHLSSHTYSTRPQASHTSSRSSTSSESSTSSSYSSSSDQFATRASMDSATQPRVVVLRCSRCAKCVETIVGPSRGSNDLKRVSTDDAIASGMVRFGHNLYYCERCAKMVGYK